MFGEESDTEGLSEKKKKEIEYSYINLIIDETKFVFNDPQFQKSCLKLSRSVPKFQKYTLGIMRMKKATSQRNLTALNTSHGMSLKQLKSALK